MGRLDDVIGAVSEASEVTVKVAERKAGDAKPAKAPKPELPLHPISVPPLEPPPPQMSPWLAALMDDFADSRPGDTVNIHGGRVVRTADGFVSHRHGGDAKSHATPHEAAQHLLTTLALEKHQHAVERHEQRHAAAVGMHAQATAAALERAEEAAALFDPVKHPRARGKFRDLGVVDTATQPHGHEQFFETHPKRRRRKGKGLSPETQRRIVSELYPNLHLAAALEQVELAAAGQTKRCLTPFGLRRLEEFALPYRGSPLHAHFDPRQHARSRVGRFVDMLSKLERAEHGSTVTLPHGVVVRRDLRGLQVEGGGHEPVELAGAHGAAGEALFRHTVASGEGHDELIGDLAQARRQAAAAQHGGDALHLAGRTRLARLDARGARKRYLDALTPELFGKGAGRVYAGGAAPRVERVLAGVQGRANQAAREPLVSSIQRSLAKMAVTRSADAETKATHRALRAKFGMDPDIYARGEPAGRKNEPAVPPAGRRSLKSVVHDVPMRGAFPDRAGPQFNSWGLAGGDHDVTDAVKKNVPAHVAGDVDKVSVHVDPNESSYAWETSIKWKDGTESGDQYEQEHDLGDLYDDVARHWYWSKQQAQMKKLDPSKFRLGDRVHYIRNYDPATGSQGEFADVGTLVGYERGENRFAVRASDGTRLTHGYMNLGIFGHEPLPEPERKKAVKAEVALQRAHQKKLRAAGHHDQADVNEIQVVRPLLRSVGLKAGGV